MRRLRVSVTQEIPRVQFLLWQSLPAAQWFELEFMIGGGSVDRSANFTKKETSSRGLRCRRPHYQGDLPHLRKITAVDLQIRLGEENLAAGMRVIPTHWLEFT
jgi:hypothetical protein